MAEARAYTHGDLFHGFVCFCKVLIIHKSICKENNKAKKKKKIWKKKLDLKKLEDKTIVNGWDKQINYQASKWSSGRACLFLCLFVT